MLKHLPEAPLPRILLRTLILFKTHCKNPSKNPFDNFLQGPSTSVGGTDCAFSPELGEGQTNSLSSAFETALSETFSKGYLRNPLWRIASLPLLRASCTRSRRIWVSSCLELEALLNSDTSGQNIRTAELRFPYFWTQGAYRLRTRS